MFLIMQTQTGGVAGTPVNSQLPVTLTTKYVKVCNQNLTAAQCTAAAPTAAGDIFYDDFSRVGTAPAAPKGLTAIVK